MTCPHCKNTAAIRDALVQLTAGLYDIAQEMAPFGSGVYDRVLRTQFAIESIESCDEHTPKGDGNHD